MLKAQLLLPKLFWLLGRAAEVFEHMVAAQGGGNGILSNYGCSLKVASTTVAIKPQRSGYVNAIDTRAVGMAVVAMNGGRTDPKASIDHSVGFTDICQIGDYVDENNPLALVRCHGDDQAEQAASTFQVSGLVLVMPRWSRALH